MLSCREWTENGQLWVQQVSSTPATRLDVVNLQVYMQGSYIIPGQVALAVNLIVDGSYCFENARG